MGTTPQSNIGRINIKIPEDTSRTSIPYLMAAIVSGGEIIGYLPIKTTDNGDGTASLDVNSSAVITFDKDIDIGDIHLLNLANVRFNPATKEDQLAGVVEHHNGIATVTPATVNFSGISKSILIENRDNAQDLLVSFDGDANTKTISPGQSLGVDANHTSVRVSSSLLTVSYEMLVTV